MTGQESLTIGDVVKHHLHGKKKVIVGITRHNFLCTSLENIQTDGRLQQGAHVAIHSQDNLQKIGHMDQVIPVSLFQLRGNKTRRMDGAPRRNLKTAIAFYVPRCVFSAALIYFTLSAIEKVRSGVEYYFFARIVEGALAMHHSDKKESEQAKGKEREWNEAGQKELGMVKKQLGLSDEKIEGLQRQYLKERLSEEELFRLAKKYAAGAMSDSEKKALKEKYLKPDVSKEEVESVRRQFLGW